MSASLLVKALSDQSGQFYVGQPALLEAVRCSKSGDHRRISEIFRFLSTSHDYSLVKSFPKEVYDLLKTASKIATPEIQEIIYSSKTPSLLANYEEAVAAVKPKKSFSIFDGDGVEVRVNSTAVRLFFPELMIAAKNFFKANAGSVPPVAASAHETDKPLEPPVKRARGAEADAQDEQASPISRPKYVITKEFFPFLENTALKGLLSCCMERRDLPLTLRETLQALAAAKLVESQSPQTQNRVSDRLFQSSLFTYLAKERWNHPCSLPKDALALLAYVIASSSALTAAEQDDDAPVGLLDAGSEEMNTLLAPLACLSKSQVERLIQDYQQNLQLSPAMMVDLCKNKIFFAAVSQCRELRRITVIPRTSDEANLVLMFQNEELKRLSWEIRRTMNNGKQDSETIEHREPAQ